MVKLIIVESPTKARTITRYLGNEYKVVASQGHVRDLSLSGKGSLGVDVENGFIPDYVISQRSQKTINYLIKLSEDAQEIFLATDPDREGEAIAWHLADILNLDVQKTKRLAFHEITKRAVNEAFENASTIDMNLVKSQETRRILDRIIGFELSGLLQKKIFTRSAGRVQSVALRLIADRQKQIDCFVEKVTYGVNLNIENEKEYVDFELVNEKLEAVREVEDAKLKKYKSLVNEYLTVKDIEESISDKYAFPPFTTSSLQQDAFNKFNFSSSKTNKIAQKLYEGVAIGKETTGLITYMRTDSIRINSGFVYGVKQHIKETYGEEYVGFARTQSASGKVQDAHEAIRPTRVDIVPEEIEQYLTKEEFKLYKLIYVRAIASIMKPAKIKSNKVVLFKDNDLFLSSSSQVVFDGYKKLYGQYENEIKTNASEFEVNKSYLVKEINIKEHKTKPPYRYSEASIIRSMEELGIGRPSTYASTIESLKKSAYVKEERGYFTPTENGVNTDEKLREYFSDVINVEYTANMENELDHIADGKMEKNTALDNFYKPFKSKIDYAYKNMKGLTLVKTGEKCPNCGADLVKMKGRYGEYVACENRPTCDYIKRKEIVIDENAKDCPICENGKLLLRKGRYGNFYGCSNFPKCRHIESVNGEILEMKKPTTKKKTTKKPTPKKTVSKKTIVSKEIKTKKNQQRKQLLNKNGVVM